MKLWQCPKCFRVFHEGFTECGACQVSQESGVRLPKLDQEQMRSLAASCLRFDHNPPRTPFSDYRVLDVKSTTSGYMELRIVADMVRRTERHQVRGDYEIHCENALEWHLMNRDPNTIMGGPNLVFYEKHPLIPPPEEQYQPGGDGETFNPPLDLKLLIIDQSYIIAEKFTINTIYEEPER